MEPKWQRISFMPATPLGEDGRRVTGSAAHIALSRRAAAEGMVLLKNENETLPLKRGSRVAVFGKAQADYVKGGGGSGDTTVAYVRSLAQGLRMKQDEGKIEIFEPLERFYAENVKAQYAAGATPGKTREPILDDNDVYVGQTAPLTEYYKERGVLVDVDGDGTMDEVFETIVRKLG